MQRIVIIGSTGSGKSTLGRTLAAKFGVPHTEMDTLHWLPGWIERDDATFRELVDAFTAQSAWVIDGDVARRELGEVVEEIVVVERPVGRAVPG